MNKGALQVSWWELTRPIAVLPCLPREIGGMAADMLAGHLENHCVWQFAYKHAHSAMELTWIIMFVCQLARPLGEAVFIAGNDIPKAFDFTPNGIIYEMLMSSGAPFGLTAFLLRHRRSIHLAPTFRGVHAARIIPMFRGIAQGTKWGPKVFIVVQQYVFGPVFV